MITINNVAAGRYFWWSRGAGWVSGPIEATLAEYRPAQWHEDVLGLSVYPHRLALRDGQDVSLRAQEGFDAYAYMQPGGNVHLMVPDLNFFPVVRQSLGGRFELYSNIVIGDPDESLFTPPAGADIRETTKVGGIIRSREVHSTQPPPAVTSR